MPIYEYSCQNCKAKFELMRPFSKSREGASCPHCQSRRKGYFPPVIPCPPMSPVINPQSAGLVVPVPPVAAAVAAPAVIS